MNEVKHYVENELSSLDRAIDYAESQTVNRDYYLEDPAIVYTLSRIHSGQQSAYKEFLRVAWGKAIRIKSNHKGEIVYRLSQAAAVIPESNVATPQSSIGRLINVAREGEIYNSNILGEYCIEDVWYFERYIGHEYLENIKNFKKMTSQGKNRFSIVNLLDWLSNIGRKDVALESQIDKIEDGSSFWEKITFIEDVAIEEDVLDTLVSPTEEYKGISLPTRFYVNLNEYQYDAAHWGPDGLVFVFGVAGSGKTSVALGRSKSLSQLGQLPKDDRLYNPDFPEETQIGIVRTGELITYLKDTCDMLSLHRLPVVEYKEIYEELKSHWDIDLSKRAKTNTPKYLLASQNQDGDIDSRMEWFHLLSGVMIDFYVEQGLYSIKNSTGRIASIDGDIFNKINEIVHKDLDYALKKSNIINYLSEIENVTKKTFERIFSQSVWIGVPDDENNISWLSDMEHDIASHILSKYKVLCLYRGVHDVQIIIPQSEKENWKKWIPHNAKIPDESKSVVPENITIPAADGEEVKINVIVVSNNDLISHAKSGMLRFYDGIGKTMHIVMTKRLWLVNMPKIVASSEHQDGAEKNTRQWRTKVRSRALDNIRRSVNQLIPSELFAKAIRKLEKDYFEKQEIVSMLKRKKQNIDNNRLSERDIDLLLAFMASITRGIKKDSVFFNKNYLVSAPYRSSVFIDEVQDFSEIQIFLLSMLSDPRHSSVTAVGDSAQCLYRIKSDVAVSFAKDMWANAKTQELTENIRQQGVPTLNALSAAFRKQFIDEVIIQDAEFERNCGLDVFHQNSSIDQLRLAYKIISSIPKNETVVIVVPSVERAKEAIQKLKPVLRERQHRECSYSRVIDLSKRYIAHVTTPKNIKGLEFDHLLALHLDEYDLNNTTHRNAIYVMMTRPRKKLSLIANFENLNKKFTELVEKFADIQKQ